MWLALNITQSLIEIQGTCTYMYATLPNFAYSLAFLTLRIGLPSIEDACIRLL